MYRCGKCHGRGKVGADICPVCEGWGALAGFLKQCTLCHGTGCYQCGGKGTVFAAVRFESPRLVRIPVALLAALWATAQRAEKRVSSPAEEPASPDYTRGVAAGILTALLQQREEEGNPAGQQLQRLRQEGGWLLVAPDGIWHLVDGSRPARVLAFASAAPPEQ